jgi:hypothetical protein
MLIGVQIRVFRTRRAPVPCPIAITRVSERALHGTFGFGTFRKVFARRGALLGVVKCRRQSPDSRDGAPISSARLTLDHHMDVP